MSTEAWLSLGGNETSLTSCVSQSLCSVPASPTGQTFLRGFVSLESRAEMAKLCSAKLARSFVRTVLLFLPHSSGRGYFPLISIL